MNEIPHNISYNYSELLKLFPGGEFPISTDDYELISEHLLDWYSEYAELHQILTKKYTAELVANTKLHHILSRSSIFINDWENFPNDLPGGELTSYVQSLVQRYES